MSDPRAQTPGVTLSFASDRSGLSRWSDASLISFLVLCAALPYVNTLGNSFLLTYDDGTQILRNPYVHSFRHLREIFGTHVWSYLGRNSLTNYYRPVMTFGYLICYKIFGSAAYGFHLVNLILHIAVVSILFLVIRRMTSDRVIAFGAAALFAFHPIHTEAVAWISAVTELEVTFFFLVTFWFFLGVARAGGTSSELSKLATAGSYVLALLSKEQALTLPLLAAIYEHFYRDDHAETTRRQKLARYGVLWLLAVAYILFRIRFLGGFAPASQRPRLSWSGASISAIALLGQYLWKLLWPLNLSAYYVFPEDLRALLPWTIGGFGALVLCLVLFRELWNGNRRTSFGLLWILATLAPVLNARWMARNVFAERYLYLPSVGFCWLVVWGWTALWRRTSTRESVRRNALLASAGIILALCALRITTRNRDWQSDLVLYQRTLAGSQDIFIVRDALGLAYWVRGNAEAAEREWRKALALDPSDATTWNYLGGVYAQRKQYSSAVAYLQQAIKLDPAYADAHLNLGAAYAEMGLMKPAEMQFQAAVALSPLNVQARNVLGKLYFDLGRLREAEEQFRQSTEIESNVAAYDHLGYIYLRRGNRERAERAFKAALMVNASDSRAHFSLGAIYVDAGRYAEAEREYLAGLETDPYDPEALAALQKLRHQFSDANSPKPRS